MIDDVDLDADVEENLAKQAHTKRAVKRKYTQEINKLKAQITIRP